MIYSRHAEGELVRLFFLYVLICLLTKKKKKKKKRTEGNARGMSIGLRNENNTSSSAHLTSLPSATWGHDTHTQTHETPSVRPCLMSTLCSGSSSPLEYTHTHTHTHTQLTLGSLWTLTRLVDSWCLSIRGGRGDSPPCNIDCCQNLQGKQLKI